MGATHYGVRHLSAALVALAVVIAAPERARACTDAGAPPACKTASFGVAEGGTIPANVPGIPFGGGDGTSVFEPSLYDAAGTVWPTSIVLGVGGKYLVPSTPLTESSNWTIKWTEPCGAATTAERGFSTSTNKPLPTTAGTVSAVVGRAGPDSCGSLTVPDEGVGNAAKLSLTTAPELVPFFSVSQLDWAIDGKSYDSGRGYTIVWTTCGSERYGGPPPITPGKHVVSVRAIIGNGPSTAWTDTEITLTCPGSAAEADAGGDGGDAVPTVAASASSPSAGCAMGSQSASAASWMMLVALIASLVRRRK